VELGGRALRPRCQPLRLHRQWGAYGHSLSRQLFFALIGNPGYSQYYQQEVRRHLNSALSAENVWRHIHRHRDTIAADIKSEVEARGYGQEQWQAQIAKMEKLVKNSGRIFQSYTEEYFSPQISPAIEDRVAMIESQDGRRHLVYRVADGQLHEITVSSGGSHDQNAPISLLAKAPPAAGHPVVYSLQPGKRRVLYRGMSGHLHELSTAVVGAEAGLWRHTDLTDQLEIPIAGGDPSVAVCDGLPHVVYVDRTGRLREQWHHHPLPAAPRPAGGAIISRSGSALHVTYRTMFGAVCEQTLQRPVNKANGRSWTPRLIHRLPAAGRPIGFSQDGKRHIIFRVPEKWPSGEPFVFDFIERRQADYQQYRGPRNTLVWAWDNGGRFRRLQPIGKLLSPVVGNPYVTYDAKGDRHYLAFRDTEGQIQEASLNQGSWQLTDLTALAAAPPAAGDPSGLVSTLTGLRYYVYRGHQGHLHQLCFDGSWSYRHLSAARPK